MKELTRPIDTYYKLLKFMEENKIDPRDMALACKIYESIYEEQSKYFNIHSYLDGKPINR